MAYPVSLYPTEFYDKVGELGTQESVTLPNWLHTLSLLLVSLYATSSVLSVDVRIVRE